MTPRSRRRLRWLVPVAAVASTTIVASLPHVLPVGADPVPVLPALTPAQLLMKVKNANVTTLSGDIKLSANLGLPDLGALGVGGGSFLDLLTGTHSAHLWIDGTDHARLALDASGAETDWIVNGQDAWVWDSASQSVKHATLAAHDSTADNDGASDKTSVLPSIDPSVAAGALLSAIDPTTSVTVTTPGYVAGRPVYELVVAPRSADSTIADGVISVDSATGIPLGVRIEAKGSTSPAISVAFTSVYFDKPAASTFDFSPPPGASVTEVSNPSQLLPLGNFGHGRGDRIRRASSDSKAAKPPVADGSAPSATAGNNTKPVGGDNGTGPKVKTVGTDWTTVAIVSDLQLGRQFQQLFSSSPAIAVGSTTGHLVSTSLINVLILDDGRIVVGAVTPEALESAAAAA